MMGLSLRLPAPPRNQHPKTQVSAWTGGTKYQTQAVWEGTSRKGGAKDRLSFTSGTYHSCCGSISSISCTRAAAQPPSL
jgi:hypothetical protein